MEKFYTTHKYSIEAIAERVEKAKSEIVDEKSRLLIMNLSQTKLSVLKMLHEDIQEICDCLFLGKHVAALTMTNLLFETMVKFTLAFHKAGGRTMDDGYDFEDILKPELEEFESRSNRNNRLVDNLAKLLDIGYISTDEHKMLSNLRKRFRNPYSHGSNNDYVNNGTTLICEWDFKTKTAIHKTVNVTGNPHLLINARRTVVKNEGLKYFTTIVYYIIEFDKKLHLLYQPK